MVNITLASNELFRREADERFDSLESLVDHCQTEMAQAEEVWRSPRELFATSTPHKLLLSTTPPASQQFEPNDWSFGQLCRQAGVAKETVNRLSPPTASMVFAETFLPSDRPLQLFTAPPAAADHKPQLRAIQAASYTRLYNAEVLEVVEEFQSDFQPPQVGINGGTGLYCGEQDMFCFMIDPEGWIDIEDQAFAPGFFVWNSEVGRRSLGMMTFWFQKVCGNHIVWDATDICTFSRKHTAKVHEGLDDVRAMIEKLVVKRDQRKDAFAQIMVQAMTTRLGHDAAEVIDALVKQGLSRKLGEEAVQLAEQNGGLNLFSVVDALTRRSQQLSFAGARTEADQQAARLLALAV